MSKTQYPVFTIGHSNHSLADFIELLQAHDMDEVVDVRSAPYSGYAPHFNHDVLKDALENVGIDYLFMGGELGGRAADRSCYDAVGRVRYDKVAETDGFNDGLNQVIRGADEHCIALMCSEKEPLECHRTLLVAHNLAKRGIEVQHILADSELESHDETMNRLLGLFQLPPDGDMFRTRDDMIAEAVVFQAKRFAFVNDRMKTQHGD